MAWVLGLAVAVAPPVALRDDAEGYETGCSCHLFSLHEPISIPQHHILLLMIWICQTLLKHR